MRQYLTFDITENGNLKISLTEDGREELQDMLENQEVLHINMWTDLCEYDMCNGGYTIIAPEYVGALTDSVLFVHQDNVEYPDTGNPHLTSADAPVYWFPNYMVENELETLLKEGHVIFTSSEK